MKTTMKVLRSLLCCMMVAFALMFCFSMNAEAATAGSIKSVTNVSDGVKVSWNRASTKTGYYIYRKAGSATKWTKVKKITSKDTLSWIDTNVTNGTKYTYRVRPYKGTTITKLTSTKKTYRLVTPKITSLVGNSAGKFTVKSSTNTKATGFKITYSLSSSFTNSKTVKVAGTALNKTITGLTANKTYYVKIRAYKTVSGTDFHSGYSAVSTVKTVTPVSAYTAYTLKRSTTLYSAVDFNSTKLYVPYMSKMTYQGITKASSTGDWVKVTYNNKVYYVWDKVNETTFSKTPLDFSQFYTQATTTYQKQLLDVCKAVYALPTEYAHSQSYGIKNANGKYGFDCSGFVSYVMNQVYAKSGVPIYITKTILDQYNMTDLYNIGEAGQFKTQTVMKGTLNESLLKVGDVLYFYLKTDSKEVTHCGIYLGKDKVSGKGIFMHATNNSSLTANGVHVMLLEDVYAKPITPVTGSSTYGLVAVKRFLPTAITPINETVTLSSSTEIYSKFAVVPGKDAFGDTQIYGGYYAGSTTTLGSGTEVTIIYTSPNQYGSTGGGSVAYVQYTGADGAAHKGYMRY